jgi:HlyD family secretion protein
MEAQVSPTVVRREEYGFMKGRIETIGDVPVTVQAVKAVTGNDELATLFLESGVKVEVHVSLLRDDATPSGYVWSTTPGPPYRIQGGTRVVASVVVGHASPFNYYVAPLFKTLIGG